jgi:hypothetical protein
MVVLSMIFFSVSAQATINLTLTGGSVPADGEAAEFLVSLDKNTELIPIYAFDIPLHFDDDVIVILNVTAGSGSAAWGDPAWNVSHGVLRIAHAGSTPIVVPSPLFKITMVAAVNSSSTVTSMEFSSILLNDGSTVASGAGATVSVVGIPIYVNGVTISPSELEVLEGQTVIFHGIVDTNGDASVDWSFGDGFQIGQILPTGVYVAPTELAESREIVIRASSRIFPEAYGEAFITVLPVVGDPQPELWVTANPANRRFVEIYASVGANPDAVVRIQVGGETLEAIAVGSPVFAHRATFQADPSLGSASISIEVDDVSISRTIHF